MAGESVKLICPNLRCRSLLSVPAAARGKTVRCSQCGSRVKVPLTARVKKQEPVAVNPQPDEHETAAADQKQATSTD